MKTTKPLFIVFEGIDGAGTTTQAKLLTEKFQAAGIPIVGTCEPTPGIIGTLIRRILKKEVILHASDVNEKIMALLFAADRLDHCDFIQENLADGVSVVSDRYVLSSLAYQSIGCDMPWIIEINDYSIKSDTEPDVVFYLDVKTATAMARIEARNADRDIYESKKFLKKVNQNYSELWENIGKKAFKLNGELSPIMIHENVMDILIAEDLIWLEVQHD